MDGPHPIITQTVGIVRVVLVRGKLTGGRIKLVQSAPKSPNPEHTVPGFVNHPHIIMTQAVRVVRIVLIAGDITSGGIKNVEPAAKGSNPEHPVLVLVKSRNKIVAQTVGVVGVMAVDRELVTIVTGDPTRRAKPQKTAVILSNGVDDV